MKHLAYTTLLLVAGIAMASDSQAWGYGYGVGYGGGYGGYGYGGLHSHYGVGYGSYGGYGYGGYGRVTTRYRSTYGAYRTRAYSPYSSYGYGARSGCCLSRIGDRIRARRDARYSYYGSYGCCAPVDCCAPTYGCCDSYGGTVVEPAYEGSVPVESTSPELAPAPAESVPLPSARAGNGLLRVSVPADAKVFVNGTLTTSTGTLRQYVSNGLEAGRIYSYDVRVEYVRNGKTIVKNKSLSLTAGGNQILAFSSAPANEAIATTLQIHVPSQARVTLSGAATQQTGEVRDFVTTKLAQGQLWENYTVVVEYEAEGQTFTQEKTISLIGGETKQLVFDFDASGAKLALLN